jgi:glycosyltransferase involved in cell wall biosynthesis
VTSGVLVEAVAAGKPVIATMFPHAAELLESGAGILVPQQNTSALRDALLRLLTDTNALGEMAGVSRALSTSLLWPAVANEYKDTLNHVLEETFQKDLLPWVLA